MSRLRYETAESLLDGVGDMTGKWLRISVCGAVAATALALGSYLISQGLVRASLWAAALGLPLTVVITVTGIWAAVLASRALGRDSARNKITTPQAGVRESGNPRASGGIRQDSTGGITIAHTGTGDITVTDTPPKDRDQKIG